MALTTYRTIAVIDTADKRDVAYARIIELLVHCSQPSFDLTITRIQQVASLKLEVDFNNPLPVAHVTRFGLTGPV